MSLETLLKFTDNQILKSQHVVHRKTLLFTSHQIPLYLVSRVKPEAKIHMKEYFKSTHSTRSPTSPFFCSSFFTVATLLASWFWFYVVFVIVETRAVTKHSD